MKRLLCLLTWLLLLLAACAPPPKKAIPLTVPEGLDSRLLERLHGEAPLFNNLEGIAKVKLSRNGKSVKLTHALFAEKPDKLRSEVLSPFGLPLVMLATDGERLSVYDLRERKFYRGPASNRNIQALLQIPLRIEDLVPVLLYQVPVMAYERHSLQVEDDSRYRLSLVGEGERRQDVFFDPALQLVGSEYLVDGEVVLRIAYGKFKDSAAGFPHAIDLEMPLFQSSVSVAFSDVQSNVEIPPERFRLSAPDGVTVSPFPESQRR